MQILIFIFPRTLCVIKSVEELPHTLKITKKERREIYSTQDMETISFLTCFALVTLANVQRMERDETLF